MTGVVVISLFLLLKHALTPVSFGQYGHYRGNSMGEIAALPVHYVGSKSCENCHDSIATVKSEGFHANLSCEGCHGAGYKHVENPDTEKLIKPDKKIYNLLLDRYHLKAENSVYIDDNIANVQSAKEIGMYAIHFENAEKLEEILLSMKAI